MAKLTTYNVCMIFGDKCKISFNLTARKLSIELSVCLFNCLCVCLYILYIFYLSTFILHLYISFYLSIL